MKTLKTIWEFLSVGDRWMLLTSTFCKFGVGYILSALGSSLVLKCDDATAVWFVLMQFAGYCSIWLGVKSFVEWLKEGDSFQLEFGYPLDANGVECYGATRNSDGSWTFETSVGDLVCPDSETYLNFRKTLRRKKA